MDQTSDTVLAARLEQLEQEVIQLKLANVELRASAAVAAPSSASRAADGSVGSVSRRGFFTKAGLVAAGAGVASIASVVEATPAAATSGTMMFGAVNSAGLSATNLESSNEFVTFFAPNFGTGSGLIGQNVDAAAPGVLGQVPEDATGNASAVLGTALNVQSAGVEGEIKDPTNNNAAVWGHTAGGGSGVYGSGSGTGVFGDAVASARGVWGRHIGPGAAGIGVFGESNVGRGGQFKGKAAQVRLQPSAAVTHPASGEKGDLFVDKAGRLWFCKGTTAWSQLA